LYTLRWLLRVEEVRCHPFDRTAANEATGTISSTLVADEMMQREMQKERCRKRDAEREMRKE
jgi:hypothetical protein